MATETILFSPGSIVCTPGALRALSLAQVSAAHRLKRHLRGDWGDLCDEDREQNGFAVHNGGRLLSSYQLPTPATVWVITEWDRSVTTLLLPSEY